MRPELQNDERLPSMMHQGRPEASAISRKRNTSLAPTFALKGKDNDVGAMSITIELPDLASQTSFNLARWTEILADPELARLPYRIETDRLGRILMSPPPAFRHSRRQSHITSLLFRKSSSDFHSSACSSSFFVSPEYGRAKR